MEKDSVATAGAQRLQSQDTLTVTDNRTGRSYDLLIQGELPTEQQFKEWTYHITHHTFVHEGIKEFMGGFHHDAHPMGILLGTVGALSTFYPDAKRIHDPRSREIQTHRLIAKIPTIAAFSYRPSP